uniref:Putative group i salivary lipocalin n=1 Tax=Rhipicephalus pulchellus TaxID=72859 RepID=L7LSX5_RHIPC
MKSPFILRVIFLVYLATAKTMSTTPESVLGSTGDALNIKEFLSTADPIWTYNSTQNTKILCKVDQERGIMEENYSFNRSYYVGYHNWTTLNGEGTFNEGHFTEMNVNLQGYKYKETLLYTDNYTSCAIVLVTPTAPGEDPWHEHLVKNSSITKRKNCTNFFSNITRKGRKVYRSRCLHMLNIGNATYSRWELH